MDCALWRRGKFVAYVGDPTPIPRFFNLYNYELLRFMKDQKDTEKIKHNHYIQDGFKGRKNGQNEAAAALFGKGKGGGTKCGGLIHYSQEI